MYRLGYFVTLLALVSSVFGVLPPPAKLEAFTREDGAVIQISPVEGATGYLGVLDDEGPSSVESAEPQLYFGNLEPLTEYTVIVSAIDADGVTGDPSFLVFVTGVGEITNFRVVTTSANIITLEWDPREGVDRYIIDAKEDSSITPLRLANMSESEISIPSIPSVTMIGDASAQLSGLKPMTFYKISIRGMRGTDLGPVSIVRSRTDGSGIVIYNPWTDHLGNVLGATGSIFKTLDRPRGPYTVKLTFPCELARLEVWEAEILNSSQPELGMYELSQEDVWQQEKNEIGFNYFTVYNETSIDNCFFEPREITIEYGILERPSEFTEEFDVPVEVTEWGGGGIIYVKMDKIFRGPNQAASKEEAENLSVKPDRSDMALQLVPGGNCSKVQLQVCWNVDRVYNSSVDTAEGAYYFLQPRDAWYSNDIGIMFQYDDNLCPDRTDWKGYMLVGGDLVKAIHESYFSQEIVERCDDAV